MMFLLFGARAVNRAIVHGRTEAEAHLVLGLLQEGIARSAHS